MSAIARDLRYAIRVLVKSRGYTAVAIATLALGIGASTAIFSVVNAVLLRPLPYADSERLVYLRDARPPQWPEFSVAPGHFVEWQARSATIEQMAAINGAVYNLTGRGEPERLSASAVSAELFPLLGVQPAVGRVFRPEEDRPGAPRVAILSYGLWQRRFGGDPDLIGEAITLDGEPRTVVGVMPAGFAFPNESTLLWTPIAFDERARQNQGSHYLRVVGRLADGATLEQAQAEMDQIARTLETLHPESNRGWIVKVFSLHAYAVRNVRTALVVLFGAVTLVLVIACVNVANLLLARGAGRRKELAVRAALGAGRGRLVRQLLAENLLLAIAGGALGLLSAVWAGRALVALAPTALPGGAAVGLDPRTLVFGLGLAAATPLVFGLLPSLQVSTIGLTDLLALGGRSGAAPIRRRLRGALVVGEVALALVLLAGAGLLMRSFSRLTDVNPGFEPDGAVLLSVSLPAARYPDPPRRAAFFRDLAELVEAAPGITAAGVTQATPLLSDWVASLTFEGREDVDPTERETTNLYIVSPGYFEAMGIPVLRGRGIAAGDGPDAPRVAVVSRSFAERFYSAEDPIGRRIRVSQGSGDWREIVGVVGDVKQYGLDRETTAQVYESHLQHEYFDSLALIVRSDLGEAAVGATVKSVLARLDPEVPIAGLRTLRDVVDRSVGSQRFAALLLAAFAAAALGLAAIGLYGVMAYTVSHRTLEIGIRMAHGARPAHVLRLVLGEGLGLTAAGVVLGLAAALAAGRLLSSLLFGVTTTDPLAFTAGPAMLLAVAALACAIPAWRAARVDPIVALRTE